MVALNAVSTEHTKEILDTILQIDKYGAHVEEILSATDSTMTKEEFLEKFLNAYSQNDFQEKIKEALYTQFTTEQLEEIYFFIKTELYQKYNKEFYNFNTKVAPEMLQLLLNTIQAGQPKPTENDSEIKNESIIIANESNFDALLKEHDAVIVDVYATWCGPCKAIAPILQELSEEFKGKYAFVKLDADLNSALVAKLKVKSLPTLLFYKGGKEVNRKVGFANKDQLIGLMNSSLSK